jgi:hypothetical protein
MTVFTTSTMPTVCEADADPDIMTAYIDIKGGIGEIQSDGPWLARISVHGNGKDGAEAMRDEVLAALQLRELLKGLVA